MEFNIFLFDDFETLDIFGPIEVFGKLPDVKFNYYSQNGGIVTSSQKYSILTEPVIKAEKGSVLVLPGGMGTRRLSEDAFFIETLKKAVKNSKYCLTICTGSALLAKTGLLNGKKATSNKRSFAWVKSTSDKVKWQASARWVADGKYYTASGVSAGTDMALGFVSDMFGQEEAVRIARHIEYIWNSDKNNDPFKAE